MAIASGKGGTGKTTVAASLASVWPQTVYAVDLDVEEPNLHLFLKPNMHFAEMVGMEVPVIDQSKCTHCRACVELCQFSAISLLGETLMTFPEMCHGCGGCLAVCRENALTAGSREIGGLHWGSVGTAGFLMGRLRVGEAMSPPLMREAKAKLQAVLKGKHQDLIIDAPPGVSCPAVNAVMDTDVIALVTEPTPFGLYDLKLAHEAFAPLGKRMGVIVNRSGLGTDEVYRFCESNDLPIWAEIPFSRGIAEAYAAGKVIAYHSLELRSVFVNLASRILATHRVDQEHCNA